MRVYPYVTQQNSFAQDFTNLAWEDTLTPLTNSPIPTTMSVTDITFPSIDDVDMLEPDLFFETTITNTNSSPKTLESTTLLHTDVDVVPVTDTAFIDTEIIDHLSDSLDSLSLLSSSDSVTISSNGDKEGECCKLLYVWSTRFSISRIAKNDLLKLLRDVAFPNLPADWRTLEKRQKMELSLQSNMNLEPTHDYVVHVCGKCFLYRYKPSDLKLVTPCSHCKISRIHCGLSTCKYPCVISESLGQRTMNSIDPCHMCLADSDCKPTIRAYGYRLAPFVHRVFSDARASLRLLTPFTDLFTYHPDTSTLLTSSDWHSKWVSKIMAMPFKTEIFHGKQFYNHTIWTTGIRSVVLALSIDWFPPFKSLFYL